MCRIPTVDLIVMLCKVSSMYHVDSCLSMQVHEAALQSIYHMLLVTYSLDEIFTAPEKNEICNCEMFTCTNTIHVTCPCSVQTSGENFPDLNFAKIKRDLVSADEEKRALIIQALRWVG